MCFLRTIGESTCKLAHFGPSSVIYASNGAQQKPNKNKYKIKRENNAKIWRAFISLQRKSPALLPILLAWPKCQQATNICPALDNREFPSSAPAGECVFMWVCGCASVCLRVIDSKLEKSSLLHCLFWAFSVSERLLRVVPKKPPDANKTRARKNGQDESVSSVKILHKSFENVVGLNLTQAGND